MLLKYSHQTSALDVWSSGVILLSLLTKQYPFFKARNDSRALAEIVSVCGSKDCINAASAIGVTLTLSRTYEKLLHIFTPNEDNNDLIELMHMLLNVNCLTRVSAQQALDVLRKEN